MSVIQGKGRGRGFIDVRETSLRRPGQITAKFQDLTNLINNLALDNLTSHSKVDDIVQEITNSMKDKSLE